MVAPRFDLVDLRTGADDKTATGGAECGALDFDRVAFATFEKTHGAREEPGVEVAGRLRGADGGACDEGVAEIDEREAAGERGEVDRPRAPAGGVERGPPTVEDEFGVHLPEVEIGAAAEFGGELATQPDHVLQSPFEPEFVEGVAGLVAERNGEFGGEVLKKDGGEHGDALAVGQAERALIGLGLDQILAGRSADIAIGAKGHGAW